MVDWGGGNGQTRGQGTGEVGEVGEVGVVGESGKYFC